jgi:hypothetical protein
LRTPYKAVFTGNEDRQHALPGPRPAPELTRRQGLADADLAVLHAIWTGSRTGRT